MVADGGDGVATMEIFICKSEGFWGSDVLPGTRVDGFTWDSRVRCGKTRQKRGVARKVSKKIIALICLITLLASTRRLRLNYRERTARIGAFKQRTD